MVKVKDFARNGKVRGGVSLGTQYSFLVPDTIDIDSLISRYPVDNIKNFSREKLLYIIGLLISIPEGNKALELVNGFVPIHKQTLQKKIRNYSDYLKYLTDAGVFISDGFYIPGEKSTGYKYAPNYTDCGLKPVTITDRQFVKVIRKKGAYYFQMGRKYDYLYKWYNNKLKIDFESAEAFLIADYTRKKSNPGYIDKDAKGKHKDPFSQYASGMFNIMNLRDGNFNVSVDATVGRLHNCVTNMREALRNFITYDGQYLVAVDYSSFQPTLTTLLVSRRLGAENGAFYIFNPSINQLYYKTLTNITNYIPTNPIIQQSLHSPASSLMLVKQMQGDDIQKYIQLIKDGKFYEYLANEIGGRLGERYNGKRQAKDAVFKVLFSANQFIGQEDAKPKAIFRELFPNVYEVFRQIKKGDGSKLPRLLQRLESIIVLDIVCGRIAKERPELPIFSIHDSIVTTNGNEDYVRGIMEKELEKLIGFTPKTKTEYWHPGNVRFKDKTKYIPSPLIRTA